MAQDSSAKKRKRSTPNTQALDTSKPTAIYKPTHGRTHTTSVALPSSVIANAQTHDLKTSLCGTIARALSVFCIDEVIIFSDGSPLPAQKSYNTALDEESGYTAFSHPGAFLYHVLSYLETPPVLRRALFPVHPNLRTAGALQSLDIPSHLRGEEWCRYREGVTVEGPRRKRRKGENDGGGVETYVHVGFKEAVLLEPPPPEEIPVNTRVTVRFASETPPKDGMGSMTAEAVDPALPREEGGYYWGYSTRVAESLTDVFTECPFDGGYDYSIGLSERGIPLRELLDGDGGMEGTNGSATKRGVPSDWNHLLIVLGGPPGLETAVQNDDVLVGKGITEASELFDAWVNLIEGQGSRTIRTEEALWIGLMGCWEITKARDRIAD